MLISKNTTTVIFIILIVVLGLYIYKDSLNGEFIWDDNGYVKNDKYIRSWSNILKIFTYPTGAGAGVEGCFYRPLQTSTYLIDYSIWELNVEGYHLTNITLHILVALCVFWFVSILFSDGIVSILTSILFLVHPVHTEAVCYISGRGDSLVGLFMLLSFILYIKNIDLKNSIIYIFILIFFSLALLSKENSLVFPLLLMLYHYTFRKRLDLKTFIPVVGISCIYILLRLKVLGSISLSLSLFDILKRIPGFFVALAQYMRLLIMPFNLHMEYGNPLFAFSDFRAVLGIIILLGLFTYAFKIRNSNKLVFFSIVWFFINLMPVSNIYPVAFYMSEHYLYIPSIGFFLIIAKVLSLFRVKNIKVLAKIFTIVLIAFFSFLTIKQNAYWKDSITFYNRTLQFSPNSIRVLMFLGDEYKFENRNEEAVDIYNRVLRIDSNNKDAYINLGVLFMRMGWVEEAISSYKNALRIDPNFAYAYYNLGVLYYNMGEEEKAMDLFKKTLECDPNFAQAYYNLGVLYYGRGEDEQAISLFKKALKIDPYYEAAQNGLAFIYYKKEQQN